MRPHPTVQIIRTEHSTLSAVLRSIGLLLTESRRHGIEPDFKVLRAMLFYIDEFPEKVHHTKESALLFPIAARSAARSWRRCSIGSIATTRRAIAPCSTCSTTCSRWR